MPLKDSDGRILEEIRSRELDTLSDKEFLHALQLQERESEDAKDFGPYWLDGVQGSLAEERRQSKSDKTKFYNTQVSKARRELRRLRLDLRSLLSDPESWNIKLSQLWSRYPSLEISYVLDVSVISKRKSKLLRCFLIYYYSNIESFPKFIQWEVEQSLDKIFEGEDAPPISPQLLSELKLIRRIFLLLGPLGIEVLNNIYSQDNLDHWIGVGKSLVDNYYGLVRIPYARVRRKVYKRGYRESHCNKHKSKDQRGEVMMSEEARTLDQIKQDILRKQALLFERRLDEFLSLSDQEALLINRKEAFRQLVEEGIPQDPDPEEIQRLAWNSRES